MTIDFVEYIRREELVADRCRAGIPPTEDDRKWFSRNKRSKNGWQRVYRVRTSLSSDHPVFGFNNLNPSDFITIIHGVTWLFIIMPKDEVTFGPMIDSDEYAGWRLGGAAQ